MSSAYVELHGLVRTLVLDPRSRNDLWDIVSGRSERYDGRLRGIVARLRAS